MHVVKGRLEADGIECFVRDEHTITTIPIYDIALGGIKLQVQEKDVEAAKEILKTVSYNDSGSLSSFNVFNNTKKETSPLRIFLIILLAILMLLFLSNPSARHILPEASLFKAFFLKTGGKW